MGASTSILSKIFIWAVRIMKNVHENCSKHLHGPYPISCRTNKFWWRIISLSRVEVNNMSLWRISRNMVTHLCVQEYMYPMVDVSMGYVARKHSVRVCLVWTWSYPHNLMDIRLLKWAECLDSMSLPTPNALKRYPRRGRVNQSIHCLPVGLLQPCLQETNAQVVSPQPP